MKQNQNLAANPQPSGGILSRIKAFPGHEGGAIAMVFALLLPVLIGFVGLGVDVGMWYLEKRELQEAVDSGALAGAIEKVNKREDENAYKDFAKLAVARSGFDLEVVDYVPGEATVGLVVNNPPANGPFAEGGAQYVTDTPAVEVIASVTHDTFFSAIFGYEQVVITARAVAAQDSEGIVPCTIAFDGGFTRSGAGNIVADDCGLHAQSSPGGTGTGNDLVNNGSGGSQSWQCASTSGGEITSSFRDNANLACGSAQENVRPVEDPYAGLEVPTMSCSDPTWDPTQAPHATTTASLEPLALAAYGQGNSGNNGGGNGGGGGGGSTNMTYYPGLYCGDSDADTIGSLTAGNFKITGGVHTFTPGVYFLNAGLSLQGGEIIADGAIFIFVDVEDTGTPRDVTINANTEMSLNGPTYSDLIDENGDVVVDNPYSQHLGDEAADLLPWVHMSMVNMTEGSDMKLNGNSAINVKGIVYSKGEVTSNGGSTAGTLEGDECRMFVTRGMTVSGTADLPLKNCAQSFAEEVKIAAIGLVE